MCGCYQSGEAMSNANLIERLRNFDSEFDSDKILDEAADALELADKRIAELAKFHAELHVEHGKAKIRIGELERKLAIAYEELLRCKQIMLHECGIGLVNEVVLAQIGGEYAR